MAALVEKVKRSMPMEVTLSAAPKGGGCGGKYRGVLGVHDPVVEATATSLIRRPSAADVVALARDEARIV